MVEEIVLRQWKGGREKEFERCQQRGLARPITAEDHGVRRQVNREWRVDAPESVNDDRGGLHEGSSAYRQDTGNAGLAKGPPGGFRPASDTFATAPPSEPRPNLSAVRRNNVAASGSEMGQVDRGHSWCLALSGRSRANLCHRSV